MKTTRRHGTGGAARTVARGSSLFGSAGLAAFLLALFALAQAPTPVRADPNWEQAKIEASQEKGFGRLVVSFKDRELLPHYTAKVTSSILVIEFREPTEVDVAQVPVDLGDYVSVARADPDGRAIRFALARTVHVNTMEAGEKLFIDLLPEGWAGLPPGLPEDVVKELAKRAAKALREVKDAKRRRFGEEVKPRLVVRLGRAPTFSRFVFAWNVPFDTAFVRQDGVVTLRFTREAVPDLTSIKTNMPPGLEEIESSIEDGKTRIVMKIDQNVDVRAFEDKHAYVIDLEPKKKSAVAGADPVEKAIRTAMRPIGIGGGKRTVLSRGRREPADGETSATGKAGEPKSGAPKAAVSKPARTTAGVAKADGSKADGAGSAGDAKSGSDSGPKAMAASGGDKENADEKVAGKKATGETGAETSGAGKTDDPKLDGSAGKAPETGIAKADGMKSGASKTGAAKRGAAKTGGDESTAAVSVAEGSKADEKAGAKDMAGIGSATVKVTELPVLDDGKKAKKGDGSETIELLLSEKKPTGGGSSNPERAPKAASSAHSDTVHAEANRVGDTFQVRFPFEQPIGAAAFQRGNDFWMVFETDKPIDMRSLQATLSSHVADIRAFRNTGWTAVRFTLTRPHLTTVSRDGGVWTLALGNAVLDAARQIAFKRVVRADGSRVLHLPLAKATGIHRLRDPEVGDTIFVITGHPPIRNLLKRQDFVELSSLISAQGAALVARVDDIVVNQVGDFIEVSDPNGLTLSDTILGASDVIVEDAPVRTAAARTGFIDFRSLAAANPGAFHATLARLEDRVTQFTDERRRAARFELAKFYLANRFAYEALAYLRLLRSDDPQAAADGSLNVLFGAANALAGRPREAREFLDRKSLRENADAAVWRTITEAQLGNWKLVHAITPRAAAVIGNYPGDLQNEFGLAAARAAIELNDIGAASRLLGEMDIAKSDGSIGARFDTLRGRVADAMGRSKDALRHFDTVIKSPYRLSAAEALYRSLKIRQREGMTKPAEIISQLEGLVAVWRGDEIELQALRFLAELSARNGDYRRAFEAMQTAVLANPRASTTQLLQDEMNAVFANLFLDGDALKMPPIKALSLFYDFRELTPIGRRGDEIVRHLAYRLVEVDLLDQAAALLEHQVDHRLKGAARAQIAADLAVIYLLDRKPDRALRAINRTRQARLPTELDRQRRLVEARAYISLEKFALALELLKNMRGSDAARLNWVANWEAKRWQAAAEVIERLHGSRWSDRTPLTDGEILELVRAGIAYSLAGDEIGLDRLRTKYMGKIAKGKYAKAFDVVTRPIKANDLEFSSVVKQIASLDSMNTFLEDYRRRYLTPHVDPEAPRRVGETLASAESRN